MNREIKFRGKRLDNGEWVEGLLLKNDICVYIITEDNPHECTQYGYITIEQYHRVDPATVGQSTGLKDKNGVGIFEGDIAKIRLMDNLYITAMVEWVDGCPCWVAVSFCVTLKEIVFNTRNANVEVIGNLHDNPELLK